MNDSRLFAAMDELLELDVGSVKRDVLLSDLPEWDSMAVVGFIAMVDEKFGIVLSANRLRECKTTTDLAQLVEDSNSSTPAE
jgi:acyl carrier protein